jgi:CBS domain containing-hemolysin-like protein
MEDEIFSITYAVFFWLTAAWAALDQLSGGMVRRYESKNKKLAKKFEGWLENKGEYEVVFKLLILFLTAVMAANAYLYIATHYKNLSVAAVASIVIGVIIVASVLAEIVARFIILRFDIFILSATMPVIKIFKYSLFFPIIIMLRIIQGKLEKLQQKDERFEDKTSPEDEIMSLVEKDNEEGESNSLEEDEKRMIKSIFDLDDTLVREIMTPRVDLNALPISCTAEEAKKEFIESGHSRIPVYGENVDEIKGIIYAKDFLDEKAIAGKKLEEIAHVPVFVPETKAVGDLLDELKKTNNHFAVIIDEYGGTSGIVTLEDIIEEIVGEIRDEYDTEEDKEPEPETLPDGSVVIDARTLISDVNDLLDVDIPEDEDVDTIGGYVCSELGKIPETGEETTIEKNIHVSILKADKRKIISLKLKLLEDKND